jgi:hypothetical protein
VRLLLFEHSTGISDSFSAIPLEVNFILENYLVVEGKIGAVLERVCAGELPHSVDVLKKILVDRQQGTKAGPDIPPGECFLWYRLVLARSFWLTHRLQCHHLVICLRKQRRQWPIRVIAATVGTDITESVRFPLIFSPSTV